VVNATNGRCASRSDQTIMMASTPAANSPRSLGAWLAALCPTNSTTARFRQRTRHEDRDITALSWGRRFHSPIFVSQPAMRLIEAAGGVD